MMKNKTSRLPASKEFKQPPDARPKREHKREHKREPKREHAIKRGMFDFILRKLLPEPVLGQLSIRLLNKDGSLKQSIVLKGKSAGPQATLRILKPLAFVTRFFRGGAVGFAESYMDGDWESDDLTTLLKYGVANIDSDNKLNTKSLLRFFKQRLQHWQSRNTRKGSQRNIAFHYDLGNDFYKLWLDAGMTYSSAVFATTGQTLEAAQKHKYQRMLDLLGDVRDKDILEIGCGWGGFAEQVATQVGSITGLSLSTEQLAYCQERLKTQTNTRFKLQDYRDEQQQYDHIASIEMFEAVGEQYWDTYFEKIKACLKPGGKAAIQVITIDEADFDNYKNHVDFIQLYIFPGGMLPSPKLFEQHARRAGLQVQQKSFHGLDYARTLELWQQQFNAQSQALLQQGFDARFQRMWNYYLSYCQAGFAYEQINLMQVVLAHKE